MKTSFRRCLIGLRALLLVTPFCAVAASGGDLWIRDDALDVGNEPNNESSDFYKSDDIWVRRLPDANYDPRPFPAASPPWAPLPHEGPCYRDPKKSSPNYIYVRIRNRGETSSTGSETLHVYWAKASTGLGWSGDWIDHFETPTCGGPQKLYGFEVTKPRKNGATATAQERSDYITAIQTINGPPYQWGDGVTYFNKNDDVHFTLFNLGIHNNLRFLPWHREFISRYEVLLREVKPALTLLYWDWTTDPSTTILNCNPSSGGSCTPGFMGFSSGIVDAPFPAVPWGLNRNKPGGAPGAGGLQPAYQTATLLPSASYQSFWSNIEGPSHNNAHCYIDGTMCTGHAAKDPMFFMLHANCDHLWALWQRQNVNRWNPATAYDASQADPAITGNLHPWDGVSLIRPWTVGDGYIIHKAPTHHSVVYPPIYDDSPLKIPVLQPGQACIIEIPFYPPPLTECAGFGDPAHLCLLARIQTSNSAPYGMTFPEGPVLWQNVKNNNNIGWKNVTLSECDLSPFLLASPVRVGAAGEIIRNFRTQDAILSLRYTLVPTGFRSLYDYGYIRLHLEKNLFDAWVAGGQRGTNVEQLGGTDIALMGSPAELIGLAMGPRESGHIDLRLELNPDYPAPNGEIFELDLLQFENEDQEPVGGQSYLLDFNLLRLVVKGSDWKVLDGGQSPPGAWTALNYDDSSWRTGSAPFGYNRPDLPTVLQGSNGLAAVCYFRQVFTLPDPAFYHGLDLNLPVDDGVVVYLNEEEISRVNMPSGPITPTTPALSPMTGAAAQAYRTVPVRPALGLLLPGANVLAAEVHPARQAIGEEPQDLSFDLQLAGNPPPYPYQPPIVAIPSPLSGAQFRLGTTVPIQGDVADPDGDLYQVQIFADGVLLTTVTNPPYVASVDPTSLGPHRVSVQARDGFGHVTRLESVYAMVTNVPPVVIMTAPSNNPAYPYGSTVALAADASDPDGTITEVDFYVRDHKYFNAPVLPVGTASAPPYLVQVTGLGPGHYVAFATAFDNEGASAGAIPLEFRINQPEGTPELRIRPANLGGQAVVILEWDHEMGVLEHTDRLPDGTWERVFGAGSPYAVDPSENVEFFRLRK